MWNRPACGRTFSGLGEFTCTSISNPKKIPTKKIIQKTIDKLINRNIINIVPPKKSKKIIPASQLSTDLEISSSDIQEIKLICKEIGMSLKDYLLTIQRGLKATKTTIDKFGLEHLEDDTQAQLKAALIGLEVEGYIKTKGSTTDNSKHTHVTYAWLTPNKPTMARDI